MIDVYKRNKFLIKDNEEDVWFSIEDMPNKQYFVIDFAIITAWNPMNEQLTAEENNALNRTLEDELKSLKYVYEPTIGKCDGHSEESFIVYRINKRDALRLGVKYKQYSIFYNGYRSLEYIECATENILLKSRITPNGRETELRAYQPKYLTLDETSTLSDILARLEKEAYICPTHDRWHFIWETFRDKSVERPSQRNATNEEKKKRFYEHLKYADYKDRLQFMIRQINRLETNEWVLENQ